MKLTGRLFPASTSCVSAACPAASDSAIPWAVARSTHLPVLAGKPSLWISFTDSWGPMGTGPGSSRSVPPSTLRAFFALTVASLSPDHTNLGYPP